MRTLPSVMETFGGSGRKWPSSGHRTEQLEVASLAGSFPYYDRFEADSDGKKGARRDRVADGTSSDGSLHRLPDATAPSNLHVQSGSKVPFPGLPGPCIIVSLAAKSGFMEAPGKGKAADGGRAIKGKDSCAGGPGPRRPGSGSRPAAT